MSVFQFKQFAVKQSDSAMKVGTDSVLLGCLLEADEPKRILDVGTGTGLLALMMAQRFDSATIDAIEIDPGAADEAMLNVTQSNWNGRIKVYNQAFQVFIEQPKSYDLIVSNPPYYKATGNIRISDQKRSRARHDSELLFEDLLQGCAKLIGAEGSCWFILPVQEGELLMIIAGQYGLFLNRKVTIRPKVSKNVNRMVMAFSKKQQVVREQMVTIYKEDGSYTEEYYNLTKEFYLWKNK